MRIAFVQPAPALFLALALAAIPAGSAAQTATPAPANSGAEMRRATTPTRPPKPAETVVGTGPNGATMRCRDGSYPAPNAPDSACEAKGGILVRFPVRRTPAPAPRIARRPVPTTDTTATPNAVAAPFENRSKVVVPATPTPANATYLCTDGTFIVADTSRARCASHGGVHLAIPRKPRA